MVAGFFSLFGADLDVLVWIVGVVVGIVFGIAAVVLNLQKAIVIVATAARRVRDRRDVLVLVHAWGHAGSLAEGGRR